MVEAVAMSESDVETADSVPTNVTVPVVAGPFDDHDEAEAEAERVSGAYETVSIPAGDYEQVE